MKDRTRNLAVGLTVLVALGLLGAMIVMFTVAPTLLGGGYPLILRAEESHGLEAGVDVDMAGLRIGQVTGVEFQDPTDPTQGVRITARIDEEIRLPANAIALVSTQGLSGRPRIRIVPEGTPLRDPRTGEPVPFFPMDASAPMPVRASAGGGLLPPDLAEDLRESLGAFQGIREDLRESFRAFEEIGALARSLNQAIAPTRDPNAPPTLPQPAGLADVLTELHTTLEGLSAIVGDPNTQQSLRVSLANIAQISAQASRAIAALEAFATEARQAAAVTGETVRDVRTTVAAFGERFDALTDELIESTDSLSRLLATANRTLAKLDAGEGTLPKLLNDPQLYNELVGSMNQLSKLLNEARDLVDQFKERGVKLDVLR